MKKLLFFITITLATLISSCTKEAVNPNTIEPQNGTPTDKSLPQHHINKQIQSFDYIDGDNPLKIGKP